MRIFSKWTNWRFAAVAIVISGLLLFWALRPSRGHSVFQAIPTQTAVAIIFTGLGQAMATEPAQNGILEPETLDFSLIQSALQQIALAKRVFNATPVIRDAFLHNRFAAAFSLLPTDSLRATGILELNERLNLETAIHALAGQYKVLASVFKGHTVYTIYLSPKDRLVVASEYKLLLLSRFSYLVEDALVQLEGKKGAWTDSAAGQVPGETTLRFVLHTPVLAERLSGRMNALWAYWPDWLARQTEWVELFRDNASWRLATRISSGWLFPDHPPEEVYNILPDNTALMARIGLHNDQLLESLPSGVSARDFQEFILPWAAQTAAYILTEPFTPGMQEDQFWVIPTLDNPAALAQIKAYGMQRGLIKQYDYQTFEISQFLSGSLLAPLLGPNTTAFQNPVCAMVGNAIVFAATPSAMELWIDKYVVSQTLGNMPDFLALQQNSPAGKGMDLLVNFNFLPLLMKNLLNDRLSTQVENDARILQHLGLACADFAPTKENSRSAVLQGQPLEAPANGASILWKLALQGNAIGSPSVVRLEDADGRTAIFMQDDRYFLYRLSAEGTILWRKQMDQPILSAVQGMDYFDNGQICFLFNTADAIWILNDEGRELDGFPLQLQSKATNGVAFIDFDNTHKHTLFIACANENLYGFDQFGRPLPGWNPQTGVGKVSSPLVHFKQETSDYLAVLSVDGKLSVFNRNGMPHFNPVRWNDTFEHCPLQFDNSAGAQRWVCRGDAGRIFTCNLFGKVSDLNITSSGGAKPFMVYEDFLGDNKKDLAWVNGKSLSLAEFNRSAGSGRSNIELPAPADTLFAAGPKGWLGLLNQQKRQVFLSDASGQLHPDFPLAGTTPFVMRQLFPNREEQILIVGNQNSVYAYRIRKQE